MVDAIQIEMTIGGGEIGHTWKWACTCGLVSSCTFPDTDNAGRYGARHTCRQVTL